MAAIARNADRTHMIKLLELVMGAVVNCESKETYISRILELNESVQGELMVFIQRILNKIGEIKPSDEDERKEIIQLRQENRSLNFQCEELQSALKDIGLKQKEMMTENEKNLKKIKALEDELERRIGNRN